eukprot:2447370-Rhodomonas_salina.1
MPHEVGLSVLLSTFSDDAHEPRGLSRQLPSTQGQAGRSERLVRMTCKYVTSRRCSQRLKGRRRSDYQGRSTDELKSR